MKIAVFVMALVAVFHAGPPSHGLEIAIAVCSGLAMFQGNARSRQQKVDELMVRTSRPRRTVR